MTPFDFRGNMVKGHSDLEQEGVKACLTDKLIKPVPMALKLNMEAKSDY